MGEVLSMDVPPQKPSRNRARLLLAVAVLLLALLLAGLALLWLSGSSVQSRWAALDAESQMLTAPYSAPVENVFVNEGMRVSSGQALLRLSNEDLLRRQEQAGHDLRALRSDMVQREMATERLQRAQAAWEGMVSRLTIARHEEELRSREREQKSVEHVRAQLALRGMAASGGPAYDKAARKEAEARAALEQAEKRFEQANQERAEAERDVMALRDEIQKAKRVAGPAAGVKTPSGSSLPSVDGVLTSAQDGLVLHVQTAQGQTVRHYRRQQGKSGRRNSRAGSGGEAEHAGSAGRSARKCRSRQNPYPRRGHAGQGLEAGAARRVRSGNRIFPLESVNTKWFFWGEGPVLPPTRFFKEGTGHAASTFQRLCVAFIFYLFEINRRLVLTGPRAFQPLSEQDARERIRPGEGQGASSPVYL